MIDVNCFANNNNYENKYTQQEYNFIGFGIYKYGNVFHSKVQTDTLT